MYFLYDLYNNNSIYRNIQLTSVFISWFAVTTSNV